MLMELHTESYSWRMSNELLELLITISSVDIDIYSFSLWKSVLDCSGSKEFIFALHSILSWRFSNVMNMILFFFFVHLISHFLVRM